MTNPAMMKAIIQKYDTAQNPRVSKGLTIVDDPEKWSYHIPDLVQYMDEVNKIWEMTDKYGTELATTINKMGDYTRGLEDDAGYGGKRIQRVSEEAFDALNDIRGVVLMVRQVYGAILDEGQKHGLNL